MLLKSSFVIFIKLSKTCNVDLSPLSYVFLRLHGSKKHWMEVEQLKTTCICCGLNLSLV